MTVSGNSNTKSRAGSRGRPSRWTSATRKNYHGGLTKEYMEALMPTITLGTFFGMHSFLTTAVCVALVLAGYNYYWRDVVGVRVMSFNTWGMPATFGARDKEARMARIGSMLAGGEYDLVLLEELWVRADHDTIRR